MTEPTNHLDRNGEDEDAATVSSSSSAHPEDDLAMIPSASKKHTNMEQQHSKNDHDPRCRRRPLELLLALVVVLMIVAFVLGPLLARNRTALFSPDHSNISQEVDNTEPPQAEDDPLWLPIVSPLDVLLPSWAHQNIQYGEATNAPAFLAYIWLLLDPHWNHRSYQQLVQRLALATLYFAGHDDNVNNTDMFASSSSSSWLDYDVHECEWGQELGCDDQQVVVLLELWSHGMLRWNNTAIPEELALLTSLRFINLQELGLSGTIPSQLLALTDLQELQLNGNPHLSGMIPEFPSTVHVSVQANVAASRNGNHNYLQAHIPTEYVRMLEYKYSHVAFVGTLPTEMGLWTNARDITFSYYQSHQRLTGTIPSELGMLASQLTGLNLIGNDLSGTIPTELAHLVHLQSLLLWRNPRLQPPVPYKLCTQTQVGEAGVRTPWCSRHGNRCCPMMMAAQNQTANP